MGDRAEGFGSEKSEKRPSGEDNGGTGREGWPRPMEVRGVEESNGHDE